VPPVDPPVPLPRIEGFTVHRLIEEGGFSSVYAATQHGLDRPVAIKVLRARLTRDQRATFDRECAVMGRLSDHPNIVTVFTPAVTAEGYPCIVMELCDGTYRDVGWMEIGDLLVVGEKVAWALQTIHDNQVVHHDIKPHNIFRTRRGEPAIGDFGISSIESERTLPGGGGVSVDYAAPEVFEHGGDAASDVYALGASLYQLASGSVPFPHPTDRAVIHDIILEPPPSLTRRDAPSALDRLLRRCMAKQPGERPPDAATVARELQVIRASLGPGGATGSAPPAVRPEGPARDGARPAPAGGVGGDRRRVEHTLARVSPGGPRPVLPDPTAGDGSGGSRARWIVAAVAAVMLVAVAVAVLVIGGSSGDDEDDTTVVSASVPLSTPDFVVLVPPNDVRVETLGEATYRLTWSSPMEDVTFEVGLVGTSESRPAAAPPFDWQLADPSVTPCFEVRTVRDRRVSQSASAPVCAR
jgi:tRNA A-37 threonylcarbamoyl transferase component Bud32